MQLADDDICVEIGTGRFQLRPSLRAATRVEKLAQGDLKAFYDRILNGHLSSIIAVICAASVDPIRPETVHAAFAGQPLGKHMIGLTLAVLALFTGFTYTKSAPSTEQAGSAEHITFAQHYARLYRIGTGLLGWPADLVWLSTPAEIIEAYSGLTGQLDDKASNFEALSPSKLDRNNLDKLRGRGRLR